MKQLLELGNRYAKRSTWKDFAAVKFCLCAIGVMIGVNIPSKYKKLSAGTAAAVFIATYIPLMTKVFRIAGGMDGKE